MKITLTCLDATLQHVYEDRIDAETGHVILNPQTLRPEQRRLDDRQIVQLHGEAGSLSVAVRIDGAIKEIFETGKKYVVSIEEEK